MTCADPNCGADREEKMVVIERDANDKATVFCDPCIVSIVRALNDAGLRTIASCCGHNRRPASIVLADGCEIVIARSFDEARRIDNLFPDANGEQVSA